MQITIILSRKFNKVWLIALERHHSYLNSGEMINKVGSILLSSMPRSSRYISPLQTEASGQIGVNEFVDDHAAPIGNKRSDQAWKHSTEQSALLKVMSEQLHC